MPNQQQQPQRTRKRGTRQRRKPRKTRQPHPGDGRVALNVYERMIYDPCNAELAPGIYGSDAGLLSRFKSTTNASTIGDAGYIIWCPTYHGPGQLGGTDYGNVFYWGGDPSNTQPTLSGYGNNGFVPWHNGMTTAGSLPDPANGFVTGAIAQDARVLSACMKMTYMGKMSDNRGQITFIENLPIKSLLTGGSANGPASVDNLFQLSSNSQRLGVDTLECVYRPDAAENRFLGADDGLHCAPGANPELGDGTVNALNPHCFGFAWRGMGAVDQYSIIFELIKNVEWRPEPASGLVTNTPTSHGPPQVAKSVAKLDKSTGGGWTRRTAGTAQSIASATAAMAWGAKNVATTISSIGNTAKNVMSIAGSAAPFLALL